MTAWILTALAVAVGVVLGMVAIVLSVMWFKIRLRPRSWTFDVEVDYDRRINDVLRSEFAWGAGGWHEDSAAVWKNVDFDEAFQRAVFNLVDTYAGSGKQKRKMVALRFPTATTSKDVKAYFKNHGIRAANAKELLAWGTTIHVLDRYVRWPGFDTHICPVVALQPIDCSESFTFGSADRVMALQFPGVPREDYPQDPWVLLKLSDQPFGTTEWSDSVTFVGVQEELPKAA